MARRGFCRHLGILLWKNSLLKGRTWFTTFWEIALPVIIMAIIVAIRTAIPATDYSFDNGLNEQMTYQPNSLYGNNSQFFEYYPRLRSAAGTVKIAFSANTGINLTPIINNFTQLYPNLAASIITIPYGSYADNYMTSNTYGIEGNPYWSAVIAINQVGTTENQYSWDYTIRLNGTQTSNTDTSGLPDTSTSGVNIDHWTYDDSWTQYVTNGELLIQNFIESYALMIAMGSQNIPVRTIEAIPMPTPAYVEDNFASTVGTFLGLLFTVVFLWPVTRIIKLIVEEKETRIREGMKMMGLNINTLWLSWLITYGIIFIITAILITLVTASNLFSHSNKGLIFFFFLLAQLSFWSFCYLATTLFSNSRLASTFGALIFLAIFFPYYAVYTSTDPNLQTLACLSPPLCFGLGVQVIINEEAAEVGVQTTNSNTVIDGFSYDRAMGMLLFDFLFLLLAGLYFDKVLKQTYGVALPWYYPLLPSYWFPSLISTPLAAAEIKGDGFRSQGTIEPVQFDPEHAARHPLGVRINKIRKEFIVDSSLPPFIAVNDLSLDMYEGQILALLGHNGAGKTTTINILTGMLPPTSGDAHVFGYSILRQMSQIRSILGVCPQHNILFDMLTVKEHLQLFAAIKGLPSSQVEVAVMDMIRQVGLEEKVHTKTAALSGGQKRKLSVGIALIGDSKIIFLDEPTSGMDPYSRRATWDLLKKNKEGRVIILTTHFMDEADQLGDRIAIMAAGTLQCCGSSLFLKSRFGIGYSMTVVKDKECNEKAVLDCVHHYVPNAELVNNIAGEMSYKLPLAASPAFADLFDTFDNHLQEWSIRTYGVSVTTLEEVFLRVGHLARDAAIAEKIHGSTRDLLARQGSKGKDQVGNTLLTPAADTGVSSGGTRVQVRSKSKGWIEEEEKTNPSAIELGSPLPTSPIPQGSRLGLMSHTVPPPMTTSSPKPTQTNGTTVVEMRPGDRNDSNVVGGDYSTAALPTVTYDREHMTGRHIRALFIKRWQNARKNKKTWCWTVIIPFFVMIVFLGITKYGDQIKVVDKVINLSPFNEPNLVPYVQQTGLSGVNFLTEISGGPYEVELQNEAGTINTPLDMATFLYNSTSAMALSRYGAYMYNVSVTSNTLSDNVAIWFNTTAEWSLPAFFNLYNTALYRQFTNSSVAAITLHFFPFPETSNLSVLFQSMTAIIIGIAFAFIPANFIHYAVKETHVKSKHQQMISGVSPFSYWASNFIWDFVNYLIPACLCLIALAVYDISGTIGTNSGATIVALLLYGVSVVPFSGFCSFFFSSPTSAQNIMLIFYLLIGVFLVITSLVLDIISSTQSVNSQLKFVYRLFPSYCFVSSIANIIDRESPTYFGTPQPLWSLDVVGYDFIYMAWEAVFFSILVLLIEYVQASPVLFTYFSKKTSLPLQESPDEDPDVKAERLRIQQMKQNDPAEVISIRGLRKVYASRLGVAPKVAVNDLYLTVRDGEILGFLGINGAGKTTTMKMLTNDTYPTAGDAYLNNLSILTHIKEIRHMIGYCPQFDALIGQLSAREHLYLFARIKGVSENIISSYVEALILKLGLQEGIADRPSKTYSGGNKRKLCVGIALIGNPPIVFLDEPSTGMDPGSRRFMWDLINSTMKGRSVILTTHSMEECEALCTNIAIMVGGVLRCLGTPQHIKSLYGNGYQLEISITPGPQQDEFKALISSTWPHAVIVEQHDQHIKYLIPKEVSYSYSPQQSQQQPQSPSRTISIGNVFRVLEQNKVKYGVQEYAVGEASLEQIFIRFAKTQQEETGNIAGIM